MFVNTDRSARLVLALLAAALVAVLGLTGCSGDRPADGTGDGSETAITPPPPTEYVAKLAEPGAPLKRVLNPPEGMISRIAYLEPRENSVYDVSFDVYGYGPESTGYSAIAVKMGPTASRDKTLDRLAIDGGNALLRLDDDVLVTEGGSYTGVIKLVKEGDGLAFLLTSFTKK